MDQERIALISDIRPIPSGESYSQTAGQLGVFKGNGRQLHWYGCREQFHAYIDPKRERNYFFAHNEKNGWNVARFIYLIECAIGANHARFQYTDKSNILYVHASDWWLENPMRHSFLTISLRAGNGWNGNDSSWRTTLLGSQYASTTIGAINRFLDGHTEYTGNIRGWHRQFTGYDLGRGLDQSETEALLIRPEPSEVRDSKIARYAYEIWKKDGEPVGKDVEHWHRARVRYYRERQIA